MKPKNPPSININNYDGTGDLRSILKIVCKVKSQTTVSTRIRTAAIKLGFTTTDAKSMTPEQKLAIFNYYRQKPQNKAPAKKEKKARVPNKTELNATDPLKQAAMQDESNLTINEEAAPNETNQEIAVTDEMEISSKTSITADLPYLTETEKEAKFHHETALTLAHSAVDHAILSGKFLSAVKEQCGHGNFLARLEALGIPERTARDYMRLSNESSKTARVADLGVKAALKYLSCDDETKTVIDEKIDSGEKVTVSEIASLKKAAEDAKIAEQQALESTEQWRQQYLDERNAMSDLAEETESKLIKLKAELEEANERYLAEQRSVPEKIEAGVTEKLALNREAIEELLARETASRSRLDVLSKEIERLEHEKGNKIEHQQALKGFNEAMLSVATHLSVLVNDELPDAEDIDRWKKVMGKANDTISYFQNILDDIEISHQAIGAES